MEVEDLQVLTNCQSTEEVRKALELVKEVIHLNILLILNKRCNVK